MEHKLTFEWTDGRTCAADNMIRVFESKGIPWHRDTCFNLCAAIGPGSAFVPTEYYHIAGKTFGIAPRPVSTAEYFHVSNDELYQDRGHGYTKEDSETEDKFHRFKSHIIFAFFHVCQDKYLFFLEKCFIFTEEKGILENGLRIFHKLQTQSRRRQSGA